MKAVLLAGGSGTRFWPLSRELHPKQFLKFRDDQTLLQGTVERLLPLISVESIFAVTHCNQALETCRQLEPFGFDPTHLLAEPEARNTCAAVTLACRFLQQNADDVIGFFPADHLIEKPEALRAGLKQAERLAQAGYLVTLGAPPQRAETGFGYIEAGDPMDPGFRAKTFREKPDSATAEAYLKQGGFYWNSGILVGTVATLLEELNRWMPALDQALTEIANHLDTGIGLSPYRLLNNTGQKIYQQVESTSIDYAVLEKSDRVAVVPCDMGWCDVGSWDVLDSLFEQDDAGNVAPPETELLDCSNNLIHADGRLIAGLGVDDLIVVDTPDVLLLCKRDRAQDIRKLVDSLRGHQRKEARSGTTVYKPWGSYTDLVRQENYLIKRITVLPGQQLSLQSHEHRAEHWVVTSGEATAECAGKTQLLKKNESTFIPRGAIHRLGNAGTEPLELVEIQIGDELSEDDIKRYVDLYGRAKEKG